MRKFLFAVLLAAARPMLSEKAVTTLKVNEPVRLELESNPTTGFSWKVKGHKHATSQVGERLGDAEEAIVVKNAGFDKPEPAMPGKGGKQWWEFVITKPGNYNIELEYSRPWETTTGSETKKKYAVKAE